MQKRKLVTTVTRIRRPISPPKTIPVDKLHDRSNGLEKKNPELTSEKEMIQIKESVELMNSLKRGMQDAKRKRGRFTE